MRHMPPPSDAPRTDVRALVEGLRQRRAKTVADRDVSQMVREAFEREEAPDARGLHFYVFEGTISIYGAVASYEARDAVVATLASVPGIRQITDHLTVLS
jgi:osmotically-inducible protein OsmY